jgi:hypothetical protein
MEKGSITWFEVCRQDPDFLLLTARHTTDEFAEDQIRPSGALRLHFSPAGEQERKENKCGPGQCFQNDAP